MDEGLQGFVMAIAEEEPAWGLAEEETGYTPEEHEDAGCKPDDLVLESAWGDVQLDAVDAEISHHKPDAHPNREPGGEEAADLGGRNLDYGHDAGDAESTDSKA